MPLFPFIRSPGAWRGFYDEGEFHSRNVRSISTFLSKRSNVIQLLPSWGLEDSRSLKKKKNVKSRLPVLLVSSAPSTHSETRAQRVFHLQRVKPLSDLLLHSSHSTLLSTSDYRYEPTVVSDACECEGDLGLLRCTNMLAAEHLPSSRVKALQRMLFGFFTMYQI